MSKVFISYRREDSQDITGRIYDRLIEHFSIDGVFKDVDNIPLGFDFRSVLDDAIGKAGAVLVIIGPTWVTCADEDGGRRLDSPTDFVRLEVESALQKSLPVIPVVVGRGRIPSPDELPDGLKPLSYRNGMSVRPDPDFNHDMRRLASALEQWITRPDSASRPTLNRAIDQIDQIVREREVERIDREWAVEREKYMETVMHGQTMVDGRMSGGYPVKVPPTQTGSVVGGIVFAVAGIVIAVIGITLDSFAGWILKGFIVIFGILFALIGIASGRSSYTRAGEYEAAEALYIKRRAIALASGSDVTIGDGAVIAQVEIVVDKLLPGGQAEHVGLLPGDVITKYDGQRIVRSTQLVELADSGTPPQRSIEIIRNGEPAVFVLRRGKIGAVLITRPKAAL